jgi:hypothetical protein
MKSLCLLHTHLCYQTARKNYFAMMTVTIVLMVMIMMTTVMITM